MENKETVFFQEPPSDENLEEMNYKAFIACLADLVAGEARHIGIDKGKSEE